MQELEKILEEIEKEQRSYEADHTWNYARGMEHTADTIRKHMKNEEDVLKFYYCESEDDYYLGQRVQNMYYARYADGCFTWFMSRYLPWGERVTAPETAWKEYTYPTEPKEIPFTEWLDGFIRKHMNDGWVLVEERLPEVDADIEEHIEDDDCPEYNVTIRGASESTTLKYSPSGSWFDSNGYVYDVIAWQPLPEPYKPKQPETCKYTGGSCCWPIDQCKK